MHKSPRPAILQRMNPAHGPLLAGRYAIRFFLLTDSARYVRPAPPRGLLRVGRENSLAAQMVPQADSGYPPFTHRRTVLFHRWGKLGHHHFHLRHVTGPHGKVTPELLTGMSGKHRISPGRQNVRW